MMPRRKALFLLIDALRYDVLAEAAGRQAICPNLARLAERGFIRKVVTNAQSTQFVMPSLFTQTYPLDHGGYNNGIRGRPKCFVESLKEAGFETHLMSSCNQLGMTMGYDRGFDTVRSTTDYRVVLEQRIERTLKYELDLWTRGERGAEETARLIQEEFGLLLARLVEDIASYDQSIWPQRLKATNRRVAERARAEAALLERDPLCVMSKLQRIAPGIYWRFLGERSVDPARLFLHRLIESVSWRSRKWIGRRKFPPFLRLSHYQCLAGEVIGPICDYVRTSRDRPWYVHMHVMDVHDCRSIGRPVHVLGRLRFLPRWAWARLTGKTKRRWVYDTAVMYVDRCLGQLFSALEQTGQLDDTVILVTGDHGNLYAESPRKKVGIVHQTHYEDIEVPMLVVGAQRAPVENGMLDSMGLTASLLDALGVPQHPSYKGISVFRGGRPAVISESCGAGNADIARRDIHFTVTTASHKLMAVLRGCELAVERLYDLQSDPREIKNLIGQPGQDLVIDRLLRHLFEERAELLRFRGVERSTAQPGSDGAAAEAAPKRAWV
ncbi:MAG: sulfatase-like hydrolase/transferase [Alphaproteobacteria bacterium]|nr:sulfatase-like hydrolase/transferase [Alphaproteobacteria bacterium]